MGSSSSVGAFVVEEKTSSPGQGSANNDPGEKLEVFAPPFVSDDDELEEQHQRTFLEELTTQSSSKLEVQRVDTRANVLKQGLWCRASHLWVVDVASNLVLVQRRSPNKDTFPNCWDVSCAGHCEVGEAPELTVSRELEEELGHVLSDDERRALCPVCVFPSAKHKKGGWNAYEYVYLLPLNHTNFPRGERNKGEVSALKWLPVDELVKMLREEIPGAVPRQNLYVEKLVEAVHQSSSSSSSSTAAAV